MKNKIGLLIVLIFSTGMSFANVNEKMSEHEKQNISDIRVVAEFSAISGTVHSLGMSCMRTLYSGSQHAAVCTDFTTMYLRLVELRKTMEEMGEERLTMAVFSDVRYVGGISYWRPIVSVAKNIVNKIQSNNAIKLEK